LYSINYSTHFDAAHFLKDYPGKCANIHGHRWEVGVQVSGEQLNEIGILIDFNDLKRYLKEITETLDHKLINDLSYFSKINPTAENIAKYLYDLLKGKINKEFPDLILDFVEVWEAPQSKAIYTEGS